MRTFVIATNNKHKLRELSDIFESICPNKYKLLSLADCGFYEDIDEDADTFEGNAYKKASVVCKATGLPAISDDSGLEVDVLKGAPGVYSARYAGEGATSEQLIAKLLSEMKDVPEEGRTAHFTCVMCAAFPNGKAVYARGECEGSILFSPVGNGGFGYDPVFHCTELDKSFAEMDEKDKNTVSHRALAMRKIIPVVDELSDECFKL